MEMLQSPWIILSIVFYHPSHSNLFFLMSSMNFSCSILFSNLLLKMNMKFLFIETPIPPLWLFLLLGEQP